MIFAWAYIFLGTLLSPVVALGAWLHPRTRRHWRERIGFPAVEVEPGAAWFHAASLGETRIVAAVVGPIRAGVAGLELLRTCTSDTARDGNPHTDQALCAPLDVLPVVLCWLDRVRPRALILVEAELWPALLVGARLRGVPTFLLAPRVGAGMARLHKLPGLAAYLLREVETITPAGDLKQLADRRVSAISWSGDAIVAGCTHEGEEDAVLLAWSLLPKRPLLILAPRAPARFGKVAALLARRSSELGFHFVRRSMGSAALGADVDVLLLDTVGELAGLYDRARAVFIGGTLNVGVGGHSPAEAVASGCPIVRGPDISGNAEAWKGVNALVAADASELGAAITKAVNAPRTLIPPAPEVDSVVSLLRRIAALPQPPERALRPWLWALAPFWSFATWLRPAPLRKAALPVVSIGALTAGGSGKTPVAGWLASRISGSVVVSRGYGRRRGGDVRLVGEARDLGDELVLLARRGHAVVSAPNREAGITAAANRGDRVAILDDGFQVRAVARDLEIVVVDARWPEGGGPIPVGTRRVPRRWLAKADVVWTNHGETPDWVRQQARADAIFVEARYRPMGWLRRGQRLALTDIPRRPAVALAGIARPEGFFRQLRALGVDIQRTIVFGDHHAFSWSDLQSIEAWQDDYLVITTEKDSARLPADAPVYALVVDVEITNGEPALLQRLASAGLAAGGDGARLVVGAQP